MKKDFKRILRTYLSGLILVCMIICSITVVAGAAEESNTELPVNIVISGEGFPEVTLTVCVDALEGAPPLSVSSQDVHLSRSKREQQITFDFPLTEPGNYYYSLYLKQTEKKDFVFDDAVYEVCLTVKQTGSGLVPVFVVSERDTATKPARIEFVNSYSASHQNRDDDTPKTGGETNQWSYLAWSVASLFCALSLVVLFIEEKRRDRKTDDKE